MLLVDTLLLAPLRGLVWIAERVHEAAREEMAGEAEAITAELQRLYLLLESGQIAETDFDARERELLDRLEALEQREGGHDDTID